MGKYLQGFKGMRTDINEANSSPNYYSEANNLTTSTEDVSTIGGISNIKSSKLYHTLPEKLATWTSSKLVGINGGVEIETGITILFTTYVAGVNSDIYLNPIFLCEEGEEPVSIYKPILGSAQEEGDLGIREGNLITVLHNKENEAINKIYWIDGEHQVRSLNIATPLDTGEYLTTPISLLGAVGEVEFSNISVNNNASYPLYSGVSTSGRVQYSYAYFNQNGQSTGASPLSEVVSLTKSDGQGGDVNQIVGQSNYIEINNIDSNYDYIQLYSIKYNSSSEEPVVSLIQERILDVSDTSISFVDTGVVISEISLEEFLFLGSDIYTPKAFEIKDDRMFIANFEEASWDITSDQVDCRAYKFQNTGSTGLVEIDGGTSIDFTYAELLAGTVIIPETHNCIPGYHAAQIYQGDYSTYGASGLNIEVEVTESTLVLDHDAPYYRGGETYRIGIMFVNSYGKKSTPRWVCDYKMPTRGKSYTIDITLDLTNIDDSLDIKGFIPCRVERTNNDKLTLGTGFVDSCMFKYEGSTSTSTDLLFDSTPNTTYTTHSEGYMNREALMSSKTIYPNYIYSEYDTYDSTDEKIYRTSCMQNYSILTGDRAYTSGPPQLTGIAGDIGAYSTGGSDSVDKYIQYGITYKTDNATTRTYTFRNTKMWQIFAPEITFGTGTDISELTKKVRINTVYHQPSTGVSGISYKVFLESLNNLSGIVEAVSETTDINFQDSSILEFFLSNLVYGTEASVKTRGNHNYSLGVSHLTTVNESETAGLYSLYGAALQMDQGQGDTAYNNNSDFTVSNTLLDFKGDVWNDASSHYCTGINANVNKSIFTVPLKESFSGEESSLRNHKRLEEAVREILPSGTPSMVSVDLVSSNDYDTFYGGNTYEVRTRNSYSVVGEYAKLSLSQTASMEGSGDTYYRNWSFAKSSEAEFLEQHVPTIVENMSLPIETYLDLDKRNDLTSNIDGDVSNLKFNSFDELHKYNTVYNRFPNAESYSPLSYLENAVNYFPNLIRASKQKTPGEIIDSFTDILVNEEANLNSKYGSVNKLKLFRDNMYVFQEDAVAFQSINPRAQIVADDGISVELGTGTLFGDNKYLTTDSGIMYEDKHSVVSGNSSLYYMDRNNMSINSVSNNGVIGLSDRKFISKSLRENISKTSTINSVAGFDFIRNNLYMSFPDSISRKKTLVFNEAFDEFVSYRHMDPMFYIKSRDGILSTKYYEDDGYDIKGTLWLEENGEDFGYLQGDRVLPQLTFLAKPKEYTSARFDSIEWKSITRDTESDNIYNNLNILRILSVHNEEQSVYATTPIPRNKFGMWRLNMPRYGDKPTGNRLNGQWLYVNMTLYLDSPNSNKQFNIYNIGVNYENKI